MFLDRLIDRLAGQGPLLKPSTPLAEELADPIWDVAPHADEPEAVEYAEETEPQSARETGRAAPKRREPPVSKDEPLLRFKSPVQTAHSDRHAESPAPETRRNATENSPEESEPPHRRRMRQRKPADETGSDPTAPTASNVEKRPSQPRHTEPDKPGVQEVRMLPSASEPADLHERPTPQFQPDPPVPPIPMPDNSDIEVTVHIDTIETFAAQPVASAPTPAVRKRMPRPLLSLQDYVENRRRGAQ